MSVTATHVYGVFSGGYVDNAIEHWQFGVRFFLQNSGTTPDESGTLPTFLVTPAAVARSESDWTIESEWNADLGTISIHPDDWLNDQIGPTCEAHFGAEISTNVRMDSVKLSPIDSLGHVADGRTATLMWTSAHPAGTDGSNMLPPQNSVVVSTQTPRIGAKGRGRYYLPVGSVGMMSAGGGLSSSAITAIRDQAVAFLEGLAITASDTPSTWALPAVVGFPWDQYGQITSINIGNLVDTQRRRRRQFTEIRASADVSY